MTSIVLRESGEPVIASLEAEQASRLTASGVVSITYLAPGRFVVTAGSKIGACAVGDVVVRIAPKVDIARVFYLLGFGKNFSWRPERISFDVTDDLVAVMAGAFVSQAERAVEQGLLQGYVERDDELPVLRGRLRETEQMSRRFGLAVPLLVRFDDYTADTPENQLLRGATDRLLTMPTLPSDIRRRLRGLRLVFADIAPLRRGAPLPTWQPSRLNARYHDALWLADVVLRNNSLDHPDGSVRANGFMIDMAKLFEDFVTARLSSALRSVGGTVQTQDRRHFLDAGHEITLRPDLVWYSAGGALRPIAVVDVKYKAEKPAGFPNADVYQALAYCIALRLPACHLVYAKGNEESVTYTIRNAGVEVIAHTLDLTAMPDQLERQVSAIAREIAALAAGTSAA